MLMIGRAYRGDKRMPVHCCKVMAAESRRETVMTAKFNPEIRYMLPNSLHNRGMREPRVSPVITSPDKIRSAMMYLMHCHIHRQLHRASLSPKTLSRRSSQSVPIGCATQADET